MTSVKIFNVFSCGNAKTSCKLSLGDIGNWLFIETKLLSHIPNCKFRYKIIVHMDNAIVENVDFHSPVELLSRGNDVLFLQSNGETLKRIGKPESVSLLIGVNDQYLRHDTSGYRDRFRELVNRSIVRTGNRKNHVFVLSIPDYSVTAFASGSDTALIRMQID